MTSLFQYRMTSRQFIERRDSRQRCTTIRWKPSTAYVESQKCQRTSDCSRTEIRYSNSKKRKLFLQTITRSSSASPKGGKGNFSRNCSLRIRFEKCPCRTTTQKRHGRPALISKGGRFPSRCSTMIQNRWRVLTVSRNLQDFQPWEWYVYEEQGLKENQPRRH